MNGPSDNDDLIPIGDLAKTLGLTTRTLRYWEEMGIIESAQRADGAIRGYTPYYVRRIKFIMKLKELGLTIREMQELYSAYGEARETERMIPRLIEIFDLHIAKIDERMSQFASLRKDVVNYRQRMIKKLTVDAE